MGSREEKAFEVRISFFADSPVTVRAASVLETPCLNQHQEDIVCTVFTRNKYDGR
jgi:hypothetical protein